MHKFYGATLLFLLFTTPSSRAAEVTAASETGAGQGTFSEAVSVSGQPGGESGKGVNWSGAYTYLKAPVGDSSNTTNSFYGSVGYRDAWDLGGGLTYSSTPAESLTSFGPNLWLGYEFDLGAGGSDFHPRLEPKLVFKHLGYKQTYGGMVTAPVRAGSRRTVTRPVSGSESIGQNEFGVGLDASMLTWLSGHVLFSRYRYNKDVARFMGLLDSPRAVAVGASGFSDTLGGFPKSSAELGLSLYPSDSWSVDVTFNFARVQVDNSKSAGQKILVAKELGAAWKVGVGYEHDRASTQGDQNLGLFNVAYIF